MLELECLSAFLRLLLTSTLLVASALAQTPAYTVIPFLPPGSAGRALASDINDKGSVAATRLLTGTQPRAFVWRHGRSEILPTLGGPAALVQELMIWNMRSGRLVSLAIPSSMHISGATII